MLSLADAGGFFLETVEWRVAMKRLATLPARLPGQTCAGYEPFGVLHTHDLRRVEDLLAGDFSSNN